MNIVRTVLESNYTGLCDIYEYKKCINPDNKSTEFNEALVAEKIPCRLSFNGGSSAVKAEANNNISQSIELFLFPEAEVKAGSKIVVSQNGVTTAYKLSGQPAVYPTHQQIYLELFKGWA